MAKETGIPMTACVEGRLYKVNARNFSVGVYDGDQGFIGIRTKWGRRFLDTEYHWDQGPPHGTVRDVEDTGIDCPAEIPLDTDIGTVDKITGRPMEFDRTVGSCKGWYFTDTGAASHDAYPCGVPNIALFQWLEQHENL